MPLTKSCSKKQDSQKKKQKQKQKQKQKKTKKQKTTVYIQTEKSTQQYTRHAPNMKSIVLR